MANWIEKKSNLPVTLKFQNVIYKIKSKNNEEKVILNGVTGVVVPCEMLGILGPSGSGKTTLLTALSGRIGAKNGLSGSITYNTKSFSNSMNRKTGFVTQDDIFHPHLTVTETLVYTGLLRLPKTLTREEKILHVKAMINQLGLVNCKDNIMGGPLLRGVSGGERKRVSIGQEILINPSLLFLDEPTSGLDSTSAQQLVSLLLELANGGRTVLMSIHQPSSRLFYMFHKILLLSAAGHPLFFGKRNETMDYFSSIGYVPDVAMNPADFLLDLANGVYLDDFDMKNKNLVNQDLVSSYTKKKASILEDELQDTCNQQFDQDDTTNKSFGQWSTTWGQQFLVLLRRDLKENKTDWLSPLKIAKIAVMAVVCGLLWWKSSIARLQDQIGLIFFLSLLWTLLPCFNCVPIFPQEQALLIKERSSSMYRLSAYFFAKMASEIPMEFALSTFFVTITYWMGGLKPTAGHFLKTLFVVFYGVLTSQGIGFAIGALLMSIKPAMTLATTMSQTLFLVGGYYVHNVPVVISWLKYFSHTYYIYKLLLESQYKHDELYPCGEPDLHCRVGSYPAIQSMDLGRNKAISFVALAIMVVGYRLVAYVALMRVGAVKR